MIKTVDAVYAICVWLYDLDKFLLFIFDYEVVFRLIICWVYATLPKLQQLCQKYRVINLLGFQLLLNNKNNV